MGYAIGSVSVSAPTRDEHDLVGLAGVGVGPTPVAAVVERAEDREAATG